MGLLRAMLVDDDMLSVEYMRNLIDWNVHGFQVVGTAYNGKQALKQFRQTSPHLIISDISMPLMDGIQLAKEVRAESPATHMVLLTAYDEFDYVRNAMKIGVDDYIIKSELTADVLSACLDKCRELIWRENHVSALLFQQAIVSYCSEGEDFVLQQYTDPIITQFFREQHCFLLFTQDIPVTANSHPFQPLPANQLLSGLHQILGDVFPPQNAVLPGGCGLLAYSESAVKRICSRYGSIQDLSSIARSQLQELTGRSISVFYTRRPIPFSRIAELVQHQNEALHIRCFCSGAGGCYPMEDATSQPSYYQKPISEQELTQLVQCETRQQLSQKLQALLNPEFLASCRFRAVQQQVNRILDFLQENYRSSLPRTELYDYPSVCAFITSSILQIHEQSRQKYRVEVRKAMAFMQSHYANPELCISMIAQEAGISNSRLSVIFKEDTGMTVNQYLTHHRIEIAKQLIQSGKYKIYEVAEMVGYTNSQYLSTIFYKETGQYPTDFKKGVT